MKFAYHSKVTIIMYFLWEGKVMHFLGSKIYNTHWTHWYISRFTGNKWSKQTYLIFLKAFSNCECATLEKINKEASWTLLYVRKFGIVSPKSPMPSNRGHGRVRCAPWKREEMSTGELCTGKAMETHFYTTIFFFFH